ncbi:MAG: hypothetical protein ABIJ45_10410 [Candidatus Zixiibacteriota bacterium]
MTLRKENIKLSDVEILEKVRNKLFETFENENNNAKVGDLLKVIELKNKLSISGQAEKEFWALIDEVRQKGLSSRTTSKTKKKAPKIRKDGDVG